MNAALCRDAEGKWVKTDNLVVASFTHSASRNLDPQLHTHNVIMNMTRDQHGKWRSLESKAFFEIQKLAGAYYRSHLAHSLAHDLGYQIVSKEDGFFEIGGVSESLIKTMSSRSAEIEKIAEEKGYEDAKGKEQAALMTRKTKQKASKLSLSDRWAELAKEHQKEIVGLIQTAGEQSSIDTNSTAFEAALHDVRLSIRHLTTYEAVIAKSEIIEFMLKNVAGNYSPDHVEAAVSHVIKEKELIPSLTNVDDHSIEASYTTLAAWKRETLAVNLMEQGLKQFRTPILSERSVNSHIKKMREDAALNGAPELNAGQTEGLKQVLCTKAQFVGIQGYAGAGKTFMWKEARGLAESARVNVMGFAPTGSAAEKLFEDSGIKSQTIDSFLYRHNKVLEGKGQIKGRNQLWVIDEAGLANARHILDMMILARKAGARVVFQGDGAQLSAIEWGKLFKLMQQHGMPTAVLDEIMRQKDLEIREAVYDVLDKDYHKAMSVLGERVSEHKGYGGMARVTPLVDDWMKLSKEDRDNNSLIVVPDLETRRLATAAVREALQSKGELGADAYSTHILKDSRLSDPQKGDGRFYEKGFVVQFNNDMPKLGVTKGQRFNVLQKGEMDTVLLEGEDGRRMTWNPVDGGKSKFGIDVYRKEDITLAVGDRLVWTKVVKELDLKNPDAGIIKSIDPEKRTATVEFNRSGKTFEKTLSLDQDKNFDHDYVHTAFISQGRDSKHVFTVAESFRRNLVNEKSFYVKLSRAKETIRIYTDNKEKLTKALERKAEKTSAMESQKGKRVKAHEAAKKQPELNWVKALIEKAKNALEHKPEKEQAKVQHKENEHQRQAEPERAQKQRSHEIER